MGVIRIQSAHAISTRLRVGFVKEQAPYHFIDKDGNAAGLDIDLLEFIAGEAGYELEFFPMDTGTECLDALEKGNIDILLEITQKYPKWKWMSNPLSEATVCSVVKKQTVSDPAKKIAVYQLGILTPAISTKLNVDYSYAVSNQKEALDMLEKGKADILIGMKESVLWYMEEMDSSDSYVIESNYMGIASFAILVQENDYGLLQRINYEIASLRSSGQYDEIYQRWVHQDSSAASMKLLKRLVAVLLVAVVITGSIAIINNYVRKELARQVNEQTNALQQANREALQRMAQLESESDLRKHIISYSHLGMVLFDQEYHIKLINDSALAISGLKSSPDNILNAGIFGDIVRDCGESIFNTPNNSETEQAHIYEKENRKYRYSFQHLLSSPETKDVFLVVEDATGEEMRRHEAFEEEKSKLLNKVIAGIAHEIKNPLMSIKTFVQLFNDQSTDPEFIGDFTRYVPAEVERINRLVEGLIGYAKPAKGSQDGLDLSALVNETCFFAENTNHSEKIRIERRVEPGHHIIANRDQIKQVLINIVLNGLESMKEKITVRPDQELTLTISLFGAKENCIISIRDEGMGMTRQAIERCMDPFFTTKKAGTGLGLTLSNQYILDNNGRLEIRSEPGVYTEMLISFRRKY